MIAAHFFTDVLVAGSYLLLLFIIVDLNRKKYVRIFVPRRTYAVVFGLVLAMTAGASFISLAMPGQLVHLAYKVFMAGLILAIVIGVWRLLPRDVDVHGQKRALQESDVLAEALEARRLAEEAAQKAFTEVDAKVHERTSELKARNLALEKEVIERRLAEERAAESKRRLDELIMRTNTALLYLDSSGAVLDCNHSLAQMLGRGTVEELIGRKIGRLLGLRDESIVTHFVNETLRLGAYGTGIDAQPPARGMIHIEASGAASVLDGRPCVMALFWDESARIAAEREQLEGREALTTALDVARKANAQRSDFLAKMNHELRTPLNGIIGLSEIIRHKAASKSLSAVEARKLASNIHQSGRHLLSVVDDLLDLSRIDAGTREFMPVRVSVRAEVEAALATLASIADRKRITIENRCAPDLEWTVDQRAFKQIIINLVNNAVKFSPPGSSVEIDATRTSTAMALHIRDNGPGVADADRERILAPFGRSDFAENNHIDGVGLGLTIVSELLKLQGGRIEIDSVEGKGATFTGIFPAGADADVA